MKLCAHCTRRFRPKGNKTTLCNKCFKESVIRRIEAIKIAHRRPDVVKRVIAANREINNRPDVRAKHKKRMLSKPNPMTRASVRIKQKLAAQKAQARPETRAKKSASLKLTYKNPEMRARRSKACKTQRGKQSGLEKLLGERLDSRKFVYAGCNEVKKGQPISADFIARTVPLLIQVDGCFWHGCRKHGADPNGAKATRKRKSDAVLTKHAVSKGWTVLRFWEHEVHKSIEKVVLKIEKTWNRLRTKTHE